MNFEDRLIRVKWLFLALLLAVPIRLVTLQWAYRQQLNTHPYNSRLQERVEFRGRVLDRSGQVLAVSRGDQRVYPQGTLTAHWTGFYNSNLGVAGVERWKNELLRERRELDGLHSQPGHELRLSLDLALQRRVLGYFPATEGAALLVDLNRGQVLAAVSEPAFQPARVGADWKEWQRDPKAPLLNRAFLGLYPAGPLAAAWERQWQELPRRPVTLMDWTGTEPVAGQLLISPAQVAYALLRRGSSLPLSQLFSGHEQIWKPSGSLSPLLRCPQGWQWSCVARLDRQVVSWAVALRPPYLSVVVWENSDKEKAALKAAWRSIP